MKLKELITLFATILSFFPANAEPATPVKPACCSKGVVPAPVSTNILSDRSLYQVESTWTNDAGKSLRLADLQGKPQLLTMFFASCEFACPILVHDVQRIEDALPENLRARIGVTLVSFDTERDTPQALRSFRTDRSVPAHWELWTGASDDALELAAMLGVKYRKDARGQFAHSNMITLLNAEGEIVHQQIGLNQSVDEMVRHIEAIVPGEHSPAKVSK